MRKMYLEIDEPASCDACPLCVSEHQETSPDGSIICAPTEKSLYWHLGKTRRPEFCPLKEVLNGSR